MKKILVLASFPAPYRIGVFKGLLQEYDLDVFFATDKDQNRNNSYFVTKEDFNYRVITNDTDRKKYKEALKNIKNYDAVLAYDWYLPFAMKAEILSRLFNIPYIINCDGAFIKKELKFSEIVKSKVKSFFIKNASLCLASGKYAETYFLHYGAKEDKVKIHNFTSLYKDDLLYKEIPGDIKIDIKKRLGLSDKKIVLSIGQFIPRKGFDILLDSWKEFDDNNQLILIGGGNQEEYYQEKIKKLNLKNVQIIDYKDKKEIKEFYIASDIFVLPTREDIWGLVVNEALAHRLPVVTTNKCIAGLELITDNLLGSICDPSIEGIKEGLRKTIEMISQDQIDIRKHCLKKIENYTIENVVKQHIFNINSLFE